MHIRGDCTESAAVTAADAVSFQVDGTEPDARDSQQEFSAAVSVRRAVFGAGAAFPPCSGHGKRSEDKQKTRRRLRFLISGRLIGALRLGTWQLCADWSQIHIAVKAADGGPVELKVNDSGGVLPGEADFEPAAMSPALAFHGKGGVRGCPAFRHTNGLARSQARGKGVRFGVGEFVPLLAEAICLMVPRVQPVQRFRKEGDGGERCIGQSGAARHGVYCRQSSARCFPSTALNRFRLRQAARDGLGELPELSPDYST